MVMPWIRALPWSTEGSGNLASFGDVLPAGAARRGARCPPMPAQVYAPA
jgi:hypothetical protein